MGDKGVSESLETEKLGKALVSYGWRRNTP